jgi:hypothetical protein
MAAMPLDLRVTFSALLTRARRHEDRSDITAAAVNRRADLPIRHAAA